MYVKQTFFQIPMKQEWEQIEHGFRTKWNFPGCIGAINGKHNKFNYYFSYVYIGCNGRASDGGLFKRSSLGQSLEGNA